MIEISAHNLSFSAPAKTVKPPAEAISKLNKTRGAMIARIVLAGVA